MAFKVTIKLAEAAVTVAVRIRGTVLFPEQRQRHPGPAQLTVDRWPIGRLVGRSGPGLCHWKQPLLQRRIVEIARQRPTETGTFGAHQILTRRRPPDAQAGRDLASRLPRSLQPQSVPDLPHRQSLHWAPASIKGSDDSPPKDHPTAPIGARPQGGRMPRNRWPDQIGTGGRIISESLAGWPRNGHLNRLFRTFASTPGSQAIATAETPQASAPHLRRFHQPSFGGSESVETETKTIRQFTKTSLGFVNRYSKMNVPVSYTHLTLPT